MSACNRQEETKGKDNECDPAPYNGLVCVSHSVPKSLGLSRCRSCSVQLLLDQAGGARDTHWTGTNDDASVVSVKWIGTPIRVPANLGTVSHAVGHWGPRVYLQQNPQPLHQLCNRPSSPCRSFRFRPHVARSFALPMGFLVSPRPC